MLGGAWLHICTWTCILYTPWDSLHCHLVVIVPYVGAGYIFLLLHFFNCSFI